MLSLLVFFFLYKSFFGFRNEKSEKYVLSQTNCGQFDDARPFVLCMHHITTAETKKEKEKRIESFSIHKSYGFNEQHTRLVDMACIRLIFRFGVNQSS